MAANIVRVLGVILPVAIANAGPLDEQRWKTSQEQDLHSEIDHVNRKCGTAMASSFDWSSVTFATWEKILHAVDFQTVGFALEAICDKDDARTVIQKRIKSIVVKSDSAKPHMEIHGDQLLWYMSPGSKHHLESDEAVSWLTHNL